MSLHQKIAEAVRDIIAGIVGVPNVRVRSQPFRLKSDDLPLVMITRGAEAPGTYTFGGSINIEYELLITIRYEQGMKLENGIDDAKSLRRVIRQRLVPAHDSDVLPLPSIQEVNDVEAIDIPAEEEQATKGGYEKAELGVVYRSNEEYRG